MFRIISILCAVLFALQLQAEIGDDGLHKAPWMRDTFKDLAEDLEEANAEGKRLMVLIEWAYAYLRFHRGARLITGAPSRPESQGKVSGSGAAVSE